MRKGDFRNIIPVRSNRTIQAAVLVGEKLSETPFSQEDLEFLAVLARQSAFAIENLFLYEEVATQERLRHELELARRIQISSLPRQMRDIAGLEIAAVSLPATEVGGDYYDYLIEDEQTITIVVGDVSGKGISAALYMARIQGILRSLHTHSANPRDLFICTNRVLSENIEKNYFITAIGARIEVPSRRILLSRAGHLPLFHYSASERQARLITPKGMGLGLSSNGQFAAELELYELGIAPGDICMFVTDGITDAICDQNDPSGEFRLLQLLTSYSQHPLTELRNHIMDIAHATQGGQSTPADDQTLVAVRLSALS
jgi:serine phosphatase RsbU (regulator of sigma subunit)